MRQTPIDIYIGLYIMPAVFLALTLLIGPAYAQDTVTAEEPVAVAVLARDGEMRESYDKYPNSSSSNLVGLSFGETTGFADDLSIFVPLPGDERTLCVRMVTQDARYFALNPFRMSKVPEKARFVRLGPITEKHAEDLSRYRPKEFAIRTYTSKADRCSAKDAVFLPHIGNGSDHLIAFVNGNARRATAELFDVRIREDSSETLPKSRVRCREVGDSARIAFDLECRLPLNFEVDSPITYMRLSFDDGFRKEHQLYKLLLPISK